MPVLQQCLLGGTALWPDTALLLAAVGEGIPFPILELCKPPEAVLPGRVLAQGEAGGPFGRVTWEKQQLEMPKSNFQNVLLLFLSPERQQFSGGNCSCL